jgi:threonine/homoserine/homoserine lactone efflux protein
MGNFLPEWPLLSAFLVASVALAITPGPGVIYIVTRSLAQGRRSGIASVIGVAFGNFGNALAAAVGVGALLSISSTAFSIVKYAGAAYLVYLGIRAFRAPKSETDSVLAKTMHTSRVLRDGFAVALLNPKTTVFFAAFLPQFMSTSASPVLQSMALGTLFVLIAALSDTAYALGASAAAPLLSRASRVKSYGRYFTGSAFVGLGLFTAVSSSRSE